jgi:hypothetical protein
MLCRNRQSRSQPEQKRLQSENSMTHKAMNERRVGQLVPLPRPLPSPLRLFFAVCFAHLGGRVPSHGQVEPVEPASAPS